MSTELTLAPKDAVGPALSVSEERPGQHVELAYGGPMPQSTIRFVLAGFAALFALPALFSLQGMITGRLEPTLARLGGDASTFLVVAAIAFGGSRALPSFHRRLVFDRTDGIARVQDGWLVVLRRTERIPAKAVDALRVRIVGAGITTHVELGAGREAKGQGIRFAVAGVDRQGEALDLVARIGRVFDLGSVTVQRSDPRIFEGVVSAARSGAIALDPTSALPDYGANANPLAVPPMTVPPFDPGSLRIRGRPVVLEWALPRIVRVRVPGYDPRASRGIGAMLGGIVAFVVAPALLPPAVDWLGTMLLTLAGMLVGVFVGAFVVEQLARVLFREREVTVEPRAGQVGFRRGHRQRAFASEGIREIVLRGIRTSRDDTFKPYNYRCRVELHLAGGILRILDTDWATDPDEPYRPALSFTVEMAEALRRPWRFIDYADRKLEDVLSEELGV